MKEATQYVFTYEYEKDGPIRFSTPCFGIDPYQKYQQPPTRDEMDWDAQMAKIAEYYKAAMPKRKRYSRKQWKKRKEWKRQMAALDWEKIWSGEERPKSDWAMAMSASLLASVIPPTIEPQNSLQDAPDQPDNR